MQQQCSLNLTLGSHTKNLSTHSNLHEKWMTVTDITHNTAHAVWSGSQM